MAVKIGKGGEQGKRREKRIKCGTLWLGEMKSEAIHGVWGE